MSSSGGLASASGSRTPSCAPTNYTELQGTSGGHAANSCLHSTKGTANNHSRRIIFCQEDTSEAQRIMHKWTYPWRRPRGAATPVHKEVTARYSVNSRGECRVSAHVSNPPPLP